MRLFVAVWPPDDVIDVLADLPRPEVAGVRWTTRGQWHVTLRFLGHVATVDVDEGIELSVGAFNAKQNGGFTLFHVQK